MAVQDISLARFHPEVCGRHTARQWRVYEPRTRRTVALVVSHVRRKTCWVTAYVYSSLLWRCYFNKPLLAEAISRTGLAYVTRIRHHPQWV